VAADGSGEGKTRNRFLDWYFGMKTRYQNRVAGTLIVLAVITFVLTQFFNPVKEWVVTSGVIQYLVLLFVLEIAASLQYTNQKPSF
jgi:hypothetical protein